MEKTLPICQRKSEKWSMEVSEEWKVGRQSPTTTTSVLANKGISMITNFAPSSNKSNQTEKEIG
jgi:hypothetical protein